MLSFEASSPLACERWKALQKVAVDALAHAQAHAEAGYIIRLGRLLPPELRGRFIGWLRSFSPIVAFQREGDFSAILLKAADPNFKAYAVTSAAAEPIFDVQFPAPSPGTQFAREIIRKELQGKSLKQRSRFRIHAR